ncbi:response regulator [Pantanalinema sp. GBBB05]|uniref:response regulator n=1 Tax=Pantanalinema sp. GBBB05 TaxID=2604139 RepID=UPI001D325367|nr:response regulator [Pantanalinema sp. GBBB05]
MSVKRILVVDDEANVREVVQACLRDLGGWDVLEAPSGQEGLKIATIEPLDAIVLDLMMPEMDGLAFLQALQSNPNTQSIPVIVLTAKTAWIDTNSVGQSGAKGAISKPFNPVTLHEEIAEVLGWAIED